MATNISLQAVTEVRTVFSRALSVRLRETSSVAESRKPKSMKS
jgi:hypothetical protein